MSKTLIFLLALLAFAELGLACQYNFIAYFTSWSIYGRGFSPAEIPADKITHLNYAFAKIVDNKIALADPFADIEKKYPGDNETQPFFGNFWQINRVLKGKYPHLKTMISVGGWTMSGNFSSMASTEESRKTFVKSCTEFVEKYNFDGVDIDWEYPVAGGEPANKRSPDDKENLSLLMADLRAALGPNKLVTAAVSAAPELIENLNLKTLVPSVDFLNVMTYDYYTPASAVVTAPQSNLYGMSGTQYSGDLSIKAYLNRDVPSEKLVFGIPYYGRAYANVTNSTDGLWQSFNGSAPGTFEQGALNYYNITQSIDSSSLQLFWHKKGKSSWAYSQSSKTFVAFDNTKAIEKKCDYVKMNNMKGIMIWELSQEGLGSAPLTNLISEQLGIRPDCDNNNDNNNHDNDNNGYH